MCPPGGQPDDGDSRPSGHGHQMRYKPTMVRAEKVSVGPLGNPVQVGCVAGGTRCGMLAEVTPYEQLRLLASTTRTSALSLLGGGGGVLPG